MLLSRTTHARAPNIVRRFSYQATIDAPSRNVVLPTSRPPTLAYLDSSGATLCYARRLVRVTQKLKAMLARHSASLTGLMGFGLHRRAPGCARSRIQPNINRIQRALTSSVTSAPGGYLLTPAVALAIPIIRNTSKWSAPAFRTTATFLQTSPSWPCTVVLAGVMVGRRHITVAGARVSRRSTSCRAGGTDGAYSNEAVITPEAAAYWKKAMAAVDKPHLSSLVGLLDWNHPLGLTARRAKGHVQCYADFLKHKKHLPAAVVLVRIGDFYEAVGYDALVLSQHCGLNPMSPHSGLALAGFPKAANSLRRQLNRLIEAGFTVAIVEEIRAHQSRPGKERMLVAVVSAASPYYLFGDVEDEYDGEDTPLPKPIVGVSVPGGGGYRLLRYCPQRRCVQAVSQLSSEALLAHLHASGLAPPLHLHHSVAERDREAKGTSLARVLSAQLGTPVSPYGGPGAVSNSCRTAGVAAAAAGDDVEGFKGIVAQRLGLLPAAAKMLEVSTPPPHDNTPIPPSLSTITQLGLAGAAGVPSLLSACLPDAVPAAAREWLRQLLLLPPPPLVAEAIRDACRVLANPDLGAPAFPPLVATVPGPRIAAMLAEGAAGPNMLREMQAMLVRVVQLLRMAGPEAAALHAALGRVLCWSLVAHGGPAWGEVPAERFAASCAEAAAAIAAVVPSVELLAAEGLAEAEPETGEDSDAGAEETDAGAEEAAPSGPASSRVSQSKVTAVSSSAAADTLPAVLQPYNASGRLGPLQRRALAEAGRLVRRMERFRLTVREECMRQAVEQVNAAREEVVSALLQVAGALEAAGVSAELKLAAHDDAVWVRLLGLAGKKLPAAQRKPALDAVERKCDLTLRHPLNRKGAAEADWYSSERLEAAAANYRTVVEAADKEARQVLRELCRRLHGSSGGDAGSSPAAPSAPRVQLVTLLAANELSVAATALERHVARAKQAEWNWPAMPPAASLSQPGGGADTRARLELPGLRPYWMRRHEAMPNHLSMRAGVMALLTGPNMAGKSTVLRAVAAAALLASCGLAVPAGGPMPLQPLPQQEPLLLQPLPPSPQLFASWLAHVSLRNFSGDSPLEGKSAFAIEMEDTASTLSVARVLGPRCLVLLDELGKGTEVVAGTALAAAIVEALVAAGACGVFATHLHDLVYLLQPVARRGGLEFWAMEVARQASDRPLASGLSQPLRPTRRVLTNNKVCLRSLGLQVAADCGMQPDVLRAAEAYENGLADMMRDARRKAYGKGGSGGGGGDGSADGVMDAASWFPEAPVVAAEPQTEEEVEGVEEVAAPSFLPPLLSLTSWSAEVAEAGMAAAGVAEVELADSEVWLQEVPSAAAAASEAGVAEVGAAVAAAEVPTVSAAAAAELQAAESLQRQGSTSGGSADGVDTASSSSSSSAVGGSGSSESNSGGEDMGAAAAAAAAAAASANDPEALQTATNMLREAVRSAMAKAGCEVGPDAGSLHWVEPEWRPATGHAGEAVVYVLRRWDGQLYVGESEDIGKRLTSHRGNETREKAKAGLRPQQVKGRSSSQLLCVYAVVPREAGGKSAAKDVEAGLIAALQQAGLQLRSDHDKRRSVRHRPQLPG